MDFDFKRNAKYFTPDKRLLTAGIIVTVVGGLLAYIFRWWGMLISTLCFAIPIVGVVLLFAYFSVKSNDRDLDSQTSEAIDGLYRDALRTLDLERTYNRAIPEYLLSGYDYDDKDNRKIKAGRDGKVRTDRFGAFAFIFTPDKLHIYSRKFSILEKDLTEGGEAFKLLDIEKAEVVDRSFSIMTGEKNDKELHVKNDVFVFTLTDGTTRSYCVHNTIDTDNIIENLERFKRQASAKQA